MSGTENNQNTTDQVPNAQAGTETNVQTAAGKPQGQEEQDASVFSDPKKAEEYIKSLRKENASHRTKNKTLEERLGMMEDTHKKLKGALGIEEENEDPQVKIQSLTENLAAYEIEHSVLNLARAHNIPMEQDSYFRFRISEEFSKLQENEEIGEEQIEAIAKEVHSLARAKASSNSTGVNTGTPKSEGGIPHAVSLDQFKKMSTTEKSLLYQKNPELYGRLRADALNK